MEKTMNKFVCDYKNCNRILNAEGTKPFKCSMCGHGTMRLVKPKAHCKQCGKPIHGNVDLRPDKESKEGYYAICSDCTMDMTLGIQGVEEELYADFKDTEDADEKMAYFNTKVKEAKELNASPVRIKAKGFGDRLKEIRKKLKLTQVQVAEYFNVTRRSIIYYEKNERKLPKKVKEWIKSAESTFRHFERKESAEKIVEKLLNAGDPKQSVNHEKRANLLGGM